MYMNGYVCMYVYVSYCMHLEHKISFESMRLSFRSAYLKNRGKKKTQTAVAPFERFTEKLNRYEFLSGCY